MNELEAGRVVKLIARPHNVTVDEELLDVWYNAALATRDYEESLFIARTLTEHCKFMPKPSEFNEIARQRAAPARSKALPAPAAGRSYDDTPSETKQRILAEMRATREALQRGEKLADA